MQSNSNEVKSTAERRLQHNRTPGSNTSPLNSYRCTHSSMTPHSSDSTQQHISPVQKLQQQRQLKQPEQQQQCSSAAQHQQSLISAQETLATVECPLCALHFSKDKIQVRQWSLECSLKMLLLWRQVLENIFILNAGLGEYFLFWMQVWENVFLFWMQVWEKFILNAGSRKFLNF